jgi:hypothetical protein
MTDNRLLDAVDALTKPTVDNVKQTTDDGTYIRTVPVEHPALLQQLADAVLPSGSNDHGGQSASKAARNIIDGQALYELMLVQQQLFEWCGLVKIRGNRNDLASTLRAWYVAYLPLNKAPESDEWYVRELSRWVRTITNRLDRTIKQFDTEQRCPLCKDATWVDEHGDRQPARLIASYKRDEDGRTSNEQVICQRCRCSWDSLDAIKELGEELQERHADEKEDAEPASM